MNWLDLVLLPVLALSAWAGFRLGLIKVVLGWAGVIAGIILASRFSALVAERFLSGSMDPAIANIVAFLIVFFAVFIAALVAAGFLRTMVSMLLLGWVDSLAGAFLGLAMGLGVVGLLLIQLGRIHFGGLDAILADSALARLLMQYLPILPRLLPTEVAGLRQFLPWGSWTI